jgi:hypothetical protein
MIARCIAVMTLALLPAVYSASAQDSTSIPGWRCSGMCTRDTVVRREGIASASVYNASMVATLNQTLKPDAFRGKRVRFSAWVKTDSIASADGAGLWMRVDGPEVGETLQFDNMFNRPIPSFTDWKRFEVVLDVPATSSFVIWGLIVNGKGRAWIDDARLDIVDASVASTHRAGSERHAPHDLTAERIASTLRIRESAPSTPTNLGFERR